MQASHSHLPEGILLQQVPEGPRTPAWLPQILVSEDHTWKNNAGKAFALQPASEVPSWVSFARSLHTSAPPFPVEQECEEERGWHV